MKILSTNKLQKDSCEKEDTGIDIYFHGDLAKVRQKTMKKIIFQCQENTVQRQQETQDILLEDLSQRIFIRV
jgi:hypothetical protein